METLNNDEKRLIRLFRCLNTREQSEVLENIALSLLKKYPVDDYRLYSNPEEQEKMELEESISERLYRLIPIDSEIFDLHDYDYHPAEEAFDEDVVSVILGSSINDDAYSEALAESYLAGAREFGLFLLTDFDATEQEMWEELRNESKNVIDSWRENLVKALEKRSGTTGNSDKKISQQ